MSKGSAIACSLLVLADCSAQSGPTPQETLAIALINICRQDPRAFAQLILDSPKPDVAKHVDWQMFEREMNELQAVPPVFFEPHLTNGGRAHASYMVKAREWGHHETPGKPGFTGKSPQDRAAAAGYAAKTSECAWGNTKSVFELITGYAVDAGPPGAGSGGMQKGRGHRRTMMHDRWREVGVGLFSWGNEQLSNSTLFGTGDDRRSLGGAAIEDHDGDAFYDIGEGLGAVHIVAGDHSTVSWPSGAWRLDLPRNAKARRLVARMGSLTIERAIPAGENNVEIDLIFALGEHRAALAARLAGLKDAQDSQRRKLLIELLALRAPADDEERQLADAIQAKKARVLANLGQLRRATAQAGFATSRSPFRGTLVEAWLRQAKIVDDLTRDSLAIKNMKSGRNRSKRASTLIAKIDNALPKTFAADLWRHLAKTRRELRELTG